MALLAHKAHKQSHITQAGNVISTAIVSEYSLSSHSKDNTIHFRVFNISGKEIKITGPSNKCLNISPLQKGLYFIEITADNSGIIRKLVIE
jgi:hypothetical protein